MAGCLESSRQCVRGSGGNCNVYLCLINMFRTCEEATGPYSPSGRVGLSGGQTFYNLWGENHDDAMHCFLALRFHVPAQAGIYNAKQILEGLPAQLHNEWIRAVGLYRTQNRREGHRTSSSLWVKAGYDVDAASMLCTQFCIHIFVPLLMYAVDAEVI